MSDCGNRLLMVYVFYIRRLASLRRATIELAVGLQPIIKLIAWKAVAFQTDFICAEPDLFTTRCVVSGSIT